MWDKIHLGKIYVQRFLFLSWVNQVEILSPLNLTGRDLYTPKVDRRNNYVLEDM